MYDSKQYRAYAVGMIGRHKEQANMDRRQDKMKREVAEKRKISRKKNAMKELNIRYSNWLKNKIDDKVKISIIVPEWKNGQEIEWGPK